MSPNSLACRATLCLAVLCTTTSAQSPLLPGYLREYPIAGAEPLNSSLLCLATGEFSGDYREDAAIIVKNGVGNAQLSLVLGVAGYGYTIQVPTPGGGDAVDCVALDGIGEETGSVLLLVNGGTKPGLHLVQVDAAGTAQVTQLDAGMFGAATAIEVHRAGATDQVYGLHVDKTLILRADLDGQVVTNQAGLSLPDVVDEIRIGPWGAYGAKHLLTCTPNKIDVLSLGGAPVASLITALPIFDFDVDFNSVESRSTLAVTTEDNSTGDSWIEVHHSDATTEGPFFLGVMKPRIDLRDMRGTGLLDLNAVCTHGAVAFTALDYKQPSTPIYEFEYPGLLAWVFGSPQFGAVAHDSNMASADADSDGDFDLLHVDPARGSIWVQQSYFENEVSRAPRFVEAKSHYQHVTPPDQLMSFLFEMPLESMFVPTHIQATVYQRMPLGHEQFELHYRGGGTVDITTPFFETGADGQLHSSTDALGIDDDFYEGDLAEDADLVVGLRLLLENPSGVGFSAATPEAYTEFHHHRTWIPNSENPLEGAFGVGSTGGSNPIPVNGGGGGGGGSSRSVPPAPQN